MTLIIVMIISIISTSEYPQRSGLHIRGRVIARVLDEVLRVALRTVEHHIDLGVDHVVHARVICRSIRVHLVNGWWLPVMVLTGCVAPNKNFSNEHTVDWALLM